MSWADTMFPSLPVFAPTPAPVRRHDAPHREPPPEKPAEKAEEKPAEKKSSPPPTSFFGMMVGINESYAEIVTGTKGVAKVDLPCGDCVESIASQMMR